MSKSVLIIVDVQNDFLPGGSLAVPHGDEIIPILIEKAKELDKVIATRDWHPEDHCSFKINGSIWPTHCIEGTSGAQVDYRIAPYVDYFVNKGIDSNIEQYSGVTPELLKIIEEDNYTSFTVGGLATEYCVKATVLDLLRLGIKVKVLTDAIRSVNIADGKEALKEMEDNGAIIS